MMKNVTHGPRHTKNLTLKFFIVVRFAILAHDLSDLRQIWLVSNFLKKQTNYCTKRCDRKSKSSLDSRYKPQCSGGTLRNFVKFLGKKKIHTKLTLAKEMKVRYSLNSIKPVCPFSKVMKASAQMEPWVSIGTWIKSPKDVKLMRPDSCFVASWRD